VRHQQPAGGGYTGHSDRHDHLREALRLLSGRQLRNHLLQHPVPRRNARSFGDYTDGFTPSPGMSTSSGTSATLPGCVVNDDFTHALGDQNESLLFVALSYRMNPSCSVPPAGLAPGMTLKLMPRGAAEGTLVRSPLREIRVLRSPASCYGRLL